MTIYAVVDAGGVVTNMAIWDCMTKYDPGEGLTLVPAGDGVVIGGRFEDGIFIPPLTPDDQNE